MRFWIKKFQVLSGFETKCLQGIRFHFKFFTTRQILKQNFWNVPDFFQKFFSKTRFWTKFCIQKMMFWLDLTPKMDEFRFFVRFSTTSFQSKKISKIGGFFQQKLCDLSDIKSGFFYNASDFKTNFFKHVSFDTTFLKDVRFCFKIFFTESGFQWKGAVKESCFDFAYPVKWTKFAFFVHFLKARFWRKKIFLKTRFLTKISQHARFWKNVFKPCKVLKQNF